MVHQDAKVVPEKGPSDTEGISRCQDKQLANEEGDDRDHRCVGLWEQMDTRLVQQRALVSGKGSWMDSAAGGVLTGDPGASQRKI